MVRLEVRSTQQFRGIFFPASNPFSCMHLGQPWQPANPPLQIESGVQFSLREFRPEDFEVLWRIDQKCFAPGIAYPRRELAAYLQRRGSFTIVAEIAAEKSDVAGFIVAEASRRGVGHIITIDVLPASRRGGLGSMLLAAAEERLRQGRCHTAVLETAVDNASALAFYKRHQYSVVKTVPRYYSNGVDALVLEKDLNSAAPRS
jgi:ribosomal-protein-alanine N-acetyltransferase